MRERIKLFILIPCAAIILAALLSSTPAPSPLEPFTELQAQAVQKKYAGGTFISTTTYRFCDGSWFWFAYSNGELRGSRASCWR